MVWRVQMEAFAADGWRCVAPDLRGFGDASAPEADDAYTLTDKPVNLPTLTTRDTFRGVEPSEQG